MNKKMLLPLVALVTSTASIAQPPTVQPSDLNVLVEQIGVMPFVNGLGSSGGIPNLGSPVVNNKKLYLIDQRGGIYRANGDREPRMVFHVSEVPDGLLLNNRQAILNISPGNRKNSMYVMFTSDSEPTSNIPKYQLPAALPGVIFDYMMQVPDLYRLDNILGSHTQFQVLYEFKIRGNKLANPRAIASLETQSIGHNGGGMLTLPDGRILFATGDALPFGTEGRAPAQDPTEIPSKIVIIDTNDGSMEVAASGVRNVQHMEYVLSHDMNDVLVSFGDIGGVTAEEVNYINLAELLDTSVIENFGWGRNVDGNAREGTFYVGPGIPRVGGEPAMVGIAPSPEIGFIQPQAQYGRNDLNGFGGVAVTGPVTSGASFDTITAAWSDLSSGILYATTSPLTETNAPVFKVNLIDSSGNSYQSFQEMKGLSRVDPRFFRFPDGTAGVLLEATGEYFRLTEVD